MFRTLRKAKAARVNVVFELATVGMLPLPTRYRLG
jgi:hypothetical protein